MEYILFVIMLTYNSGADHTAAIEFKDRSSCLHAAQTLKSEHAQRSSRKEPIAFCVPKQSATATLKPGAMRKGNG